MKDTIKETITNGFQTNFFRVTDEKKYRELCKKIFADDIHFICRTSGDGTITFHRFYGKLTPYYISLPSENESVCRLINGGATLYTEEGTAIRSLAEADYAVKKGKFELFDKDGKCVYDIDANPLLDDDEFVTELQKILHHGVITLTESSTKSVVNISKTGVKVACRP